VDEERLNRFDVFRLAKPRFSRIGAFGPTIR
jgi:hypothetical protein